MNIANFIEWFIQQFIRIGTAMLNILDNIIIYGNVTLMDFIITIAIIGAFISIIATTPVFQHIGSVKETKENYQPKHTYKPKHESK